MKVIALLMLLALVCASCSKSGGGSSSSASTQEIVTEDDSTDADSDDSSDDSTTNDNVTSDDGAPEEDVRTLPDGAYDFDTNVKFVNQTAAQKTKINKALEIIKLVVATDEFRTKILNHRYGGRRTFVDNGGFSNSEIYTKILEGAERLQPTKDNEMDLEIEMYYEDSNTVGYTYPSTRRIWVNRKFFDRYSLAGVARNLMHEWMHKLGFKHDAQYTPSRDYSVPYAVGDLVGEIGKDFL